MKKFIKAILPMGLIRNIRTAISLKKIYKDEKLLSLLFHVKVCHDDTRFSNTRGYVLNFHKILSSIDLEVSGEYIYPFDPYIIRSVPFGSQILASITVDYSKILDSRLDTLKEDILKCESEDFRFNELYLINSIEKFIEKIIKKLDKGLTHRNIELKRYFEHFPNNKPTSLDEALQKILFYNALFWQAKHWHNGLGRLDLILNEYYQHDLDNGILTRDNAKRLIREFVMILGKDIKAKSGSIIGDTGQYIMLGGIDMNGVTVQNDLTNIFLEIFTEIKVPDPKLILRVNKHTNDIVWNKAIDCICNGCGSPLIMNESLIMKGMEEFGYDKEDLWNVGTSACWEPLIIGKSSDQNNLLPNISIIGCVSEALQETNSLDSFDDFKNKLFEKIRERIIIGTHDVKKDVSPLYTLFFDDCISKGRDFSDGGTKYSYHGIQIVSFPNTINAILNVKKYIYDEKILSISDCLNALRNNYEGNEDIRLLFTNNKSVFGSTIKEVVDFTNELMQFISCVADGLTINGNKIKVGYSSSEYITQSRKEPASLDGRYDYEPFAVHISPVSQSIDVQEVLDFAGMLDYSGNKINGNVVDFILPTSYVNNKEKLIPILKNAMTNSVFELQLNILDSAILRDAKAHPEKYSSLVVRVWGFSAYFNDLPEEYKDNLIARAEANEAFGSN